MKKIYTFLMIALIGASFVVSVNAQTDKKMAVKINYLSPVFSIVNVGFEYAFADNLSIQLQPYYWLGGKTGGTKYNGFGGNLDLRFYPGNEAIKGFFISPGVRYWNFSISEEVSGEDTKGTLSVIGGGIVLGGQWLFGDVVTLDIYGGPWYGSAKVSWESNSEGSGDIGLGDGIMARFGTTVGFAF